MGQNNDPAKQRRGGVVKRPKNKTTGRVFLPNLMSEFDLLASFIPLLTECRDELRKSALGTADRFRAALLDEALFNLNIANLPNDEMMARRREFLKEQQGEKT